MFAEILKSFQFDKDYPDRAKKIDAYMRILNGEFYEKLPYPFSQEYDTQGGYIPLSKRRPSVTYNMCKLVVDDSTSLMFGKDHFPTINATNNIDQTNAIAELAKSINLRKLMLEASITGSVGSVALFVRVINDRFVIEIKGTQFLIPYFDPSNPTKLIRIVEKYKVKGSELSSIGYTVDSNNSEYWFMRVWDDEREIFYLPYRNDETPKEDEKRTIKHKLGLVPVIWGRNLPKASCSGFNEVDGNCTFKPAIPLQIECDYLLSQGGRGLKYSSDPLVLIKVDNEYTLSQNAISVSGDIGGAKKIIKSSSNSLVLGTTDDAKLLEINGRAAEAVIAHVRFLRELAMETLHGNRSNADKVSAAQSGHAMQQMNQPLIWLVDILRIYYGDDVLLPLIRMMAEISNKNTVYINNQLMKPIDPNLELTLKWPHWYPSTPQDRVSNANAIKILQDSQHLSRETAVKFVADDYAITDIEQEIKLIDEDQVRLQQEQPTVTETISA